MAGLASSSANTFLECLPWAVLFHGLYWVARIGSPRLFETYGKLHKDSKGYWCASIVSTIHAVIISYLSLKALIVDPKLLEGRDFFYTSPASLASMQVFFGYVLSDSVLSVYYRHRWPGYMANLIHHVCIILTWTIFLSVGCGHYFACVGTLCEATTPFVNFRWFFYEAGWKSTSIYFYNGIFLVLSWFLVRILLFSYGGLMIFSEYKQVAELGVAVFSIVYASVIAGFCLQYFWFYKLVRGAIKATRGRYTGASIKKIE